MPTPTWQAATASSLPQASQVNQLLGVHKSQEILTGVQQASQTVNGTAHTSSNGLYMAQSFVTGGSQTTVGYVSIPFGTYVSAGGSLLGTSSVSIYTNSAGAPGTALVTATVAAEYPYDITFGTDTVYVTYPVPITGLSTSTTYWIVTSPAGDPTNHYTWRQSNQVSGASTSTNGSTWTAQAYGLQYIVFDQVIGSTNNLISTWEDGGARWTVLYYNTNGTLRRIAEYTSGQTSSGYLQSFRSLSYSSSGFLTGVS